MYDNGVIFHMWLKMHVEKIGSSFYKICSTGWFEIIVGISMAYKRKPRK
jgi:hypothetical protein